MSKLYKDGVNRQCQEKIDLLISQLPDCCISYYRHVNRTRSSRTLLNYMQKYLIFFNYMHDNHLELSNKPIRDYTYSDLDKIELEDINIFLDNLFRHQVDEPNEKNTNTTVELYVSALNALFTYLFTNKFISRNLFSAVSRVHEKKIHRAILHDDENVTFYENVLMGTGLTDRQLAYREKHNTAYRDYLMCRILGTTGIRISELIGLDIDDINIEKRTMKIIRKGQDAEISIIYISKRLSAEISEYIEEERPLFHPDKKEKALLLVAQGKYRGTRLGVKSVETLVKKYALAQNIVDSQNFTAHSFRHSYAVNALRRNGNLRLVQQLLGHSNIATTTIYAEMLTRDLEDASDIGEF